MNPSDIRHLRRDHDGTAGVDERNPMNPGDIRHAYVHKDTYEELKTLGGRGIISAIRRDVSDVHVVVLHATDYEGMRKYIIEVDELRGKLDRLQEELASLK